MSREGTGRRRWTGGALLALWLCAAAAPAGETRDAMLLLESGPVHLRFHFTLHGRTLAEIQEEYVERLFQSLDTDGDGRLSREELARSPLGRRRRQNAFLERLAREQNRATARQALDQLRGEVHLAAGETVTYRQDDSAAQNDDELFRILDVDGSGLIERGEMRTAALRLLERDADRDQCITFDELMPRAETPPTELVAAFPPEERDRPQPRKAELLRGAEELLLARDLVKKYDRDGDGRLSAAELRWPPTFVKQLDRDGDGLLDVHELAAFPLLEPWLELAVELSGRDEFEAVQAVSARRAEIEDSPRPDLLRVRIAGTSITFSFRGTEPVEEAVATAMRIFNQLDADGNGYLDKDEVQGRFRFAERGLFEEMDRDGDGKLFAEEMRDYVAARAEPAANTCRVNVYNTGVGLFQKLDVNGDGRISLRELRTVEQVLWNLVPEGHSSLSPEHAGQHLHVEFVRGSYQMFGPTDGMVAQTPTFVERPPVGPEWFRAMDRNNDGDLTFDEFLGPREVFHALDADGDGLIDVHEAERAELLWPSGSGPRSPADD